MTYKASLALLALGMIAAPLSAQIVVRSGGEVTRTNTKVPPGHLPPRGLCRVWIDGVPPGQQPPVTDCATAERNRVANSRVIYGDLQTFRGRGNGKFKTTSSGDVARRCTVWDAAVVNGRVVNVCRDENIVREQGGRVIRRDQDDDDKLEKIKEGKAAKVKDAKVKVKANKSDKKDKHGSHDDDS
jgi:hypothetical protein